MKRKGDKRLLVVEKPKRRLDFLLNVVLKPAASITYSPSPQTACVPLVPAGCGNQE